MRGSERASRRHRRRGGERGKSNDERWLLTYADMITLLMALFMVLFSISSVNRSKFITLQEALHNAFTGKVLPGGASIAASGADPSTRTPTPETPFPPIEPQLKGPTAETTRVSAQQADSTAAFVQSEIRAAAAEDEEFGRLKRQVDAYARAHGLERQIRTEITRRGLRIRLLTDKVVFDSGQATIKPPGDALLTALAQLLNSEGRHPIQVDGHTDPVPISGGPYHSNWELSTARATSVVHSFISHGVSPLRLGAGGYAWYQPVASNATAAGRQRNRRVDILIERLRNPQLIVAQARERTP